MLGGILRNLFAARAQRENTERLAAALEAIEQRRFAEAIAALDGVIERDPASHEARFLRGLANLERGEAWRALPDLEHAAQSDPRNLSYVFRLATAYWSLGNVRKATEACRRVLALDPAFETALAMLSHAELPGEDYLAVLARLHAHLKPRTYIEIGVETGRSLRLASPETLALGVDPQPQLDYTPPPAHRIFAETSDEFFSRRDVRALLGGRPLELAFIDGLHHFDFALRDFMHLERLAAPGATILVHDCYPISRETAARERATDFWSGDVWRLILALRKHRPDLEVHTIAAPPTGLGMIRRLDPSSRVIEENYDRIVAEFLATDYAVLEEDKPGKLNLFPNDWPRIRALLDAAPAR